jgi:hypothetical protein
MSENTEAARVVAVDLMAILPADTATIEILKPGGTEGTGWIITFAGPGHDKAVAWQNEQGKRNLRKQAQIEQAQVNGKKYRSEDRDVDDVRRDNVSWVVSRILGWTPVRLGGDPIVFSDVAATELLMQPRMAWALNQMVEFLADERSFTPRSASS